MKTAAHHIFRDGVIPEKSRHIRVLQPRFSPENLKQSIEFCLIRHGAFLDHGQSPRFEVLHDLHLSHEAVVLLPDELVLLDFDLEGVFLDRFVQPH